MTNAEAAYVLLGPEKPPRGVFSRWWDTDAKDISVAMPLRDLIECAFNAGYAAGWHADFRRKGGDSSTDAQ